MQGAKEALERESLVREAAGCGAHLDGGPFPLSFETSELPEGSKPDLAVEQASRSDGILESMLSNHEGSQDHDLGLTCSHLIYVTLGFVCPGTVGLLV